MRRRNPYGRHYQIIYIRIFVTNNVIFIIYYSWFCDVVLKGRKCFIIFIFIKSCEYVQTACLTLSDN